MKINNDNLILCITIFFSIIYLFILVYGGNRNEALFLLGIYLLSIFFNMSVKTNIIK